MHLWSRLRLELARRPWIHWLVAGTCAAVVGLSVHTRLRAVDTERARWGSTTSVLVAAADHLAGEPLRVVRREYPTAMVPPDAVTERVDDGVAARTVPEGAVLVGPDLAGGDAPPPGWIVFSTSRERAPRVWPGAVVAVFGDGYRWCDGVVTAVDDDAVSPAVEVAVPPSCADAVSGMVVADAIVLARAN